MGYGGSNEEAGRALGRSGDGGVDGVIDQDTLGLDRVYIQAKRYQPETSISPSQIRDFFGSLDAFRASKGVFVTTSSFSKAAQEAADRMSKRIVLINGEQLTALMLRFNVGLRIQETFHLKQIDEDFFDVE
jgi:restriction system protein